MKTMLDDEGLQAPQHSLRDAMVLVPREPTEAMIETGRVYQSPAVLRCAWRAMILAYEASVPPYLRPHARSATEAQRDLAVAALQEIADRPMTMVLQHAMVMQFAARDALARIAAIEPQVSATEAALDTAIEALTIIAKPQIEETHLERTIRMAAQTALNRIRALVPDKGSE